MKGLLKRFHLNGHTTGFHPLTQKIEPPKLTLGVKGLKKAFVSDPLQQTPEQQICGQNLK